MKTKIITTLLLAALGLLSSNVLRAADPAALMQPVKLVYDQYLKIQEELAKDSLKGVVEHAATIAKAVRGDEMKMLPLDVAKQADALAGAKNLKAVREAFKPLSASLIKYLAEQKFPQGTYHEAYCPMVKASWLQSDKDIRNPYMGKAMLTCGEFKN
jgi:hypothetical protein